MRSPSRPFTHVLEKIRREVTRKMQGDRRVSLRGMLRHCRSRANAARARLVRANAQSQSDNHDSERGEIATGTICHFSDRWADCRPAFPHPARDGSGAPLQRKSFSNWRSSRQEVIHYRLVRDGFTDPASDFASRAEMNAAPDAGKPYFDGGVGEPLIRRCHAGQGGRTHREGRLVTQKQRQHAHGRASDGGMSRDVFRMIRRGDQRSP